MEFSFGTDPEFILCDEIGKVRSAIGVVPGTRSKRVEAYGDSFFHDNVLAECAVEPAVDRAGAVGNIRRALTTYAGMVRPLRLTNLQCQRFPESEMRHRDARRSGCEREYCAYSMGAVSARHVREAFRAGNTRTAGGHVHLGTRLGMSHESCVMLVRVLDLVLGLSSIAMDSSPDSRERRRLYGAAGRYRQPPHGVEYRTMGNFWLASPFLVGLVFDICHECVKLCEEGVHEELWRVDRERLESDDFWNGGGDPADCHECVAYDPELLRSLFNMERDEAMREGREIFDLAFSMLPRETAEAVAEAGGRRYDMYEEWGI
jgi:hypothetical protein